MLNLKLVLIWAQNLINYTIWFDITLLNPKSRNK